MDSPIVIPSAGPAGTREAALVYFPGGLVDPKHYVHLCGAIQAQLQQAGVALHVAIPSIPPFSAALFTAQGTRAAGHSMLEGSLDALQKSCGFQGSPDQIFLAGHSMGSVLASSVAYAGLDPDAAAAPPCRSVAMHGGYIQPEFNTRHALAAVPAAEILGDRDGLIRLNNVAMRHGDLEANVPDAADRARLAVVAVLSGVAHTSFCDGSTTGYVAPRDLPPTAAVAAATAAIAAVTARFIIATDPYAAEDAAASADAALAESTQHAEHAYFDVYRDALARDKTGDTCRAAQQLLLGLMPCMGPPISRHNPDDTGFDADRVMVKVKQPRAWTVVPPATGDGKEATAAPGDAEFVASDAELLWEEGAGQGHAGCIQVVPVSCVSLRGADVSPVTSMQWAPMRLRLKLRSWHSIAAVLVARTSGGGGRGSAHPEPPAAVAAHAAPDRTDAAARAAVQRVDPFTAARMNEHVVRSVLSRLPEEVRELYEQSPRRVAFAPDVHAATAEEWREADLSFVDLLEGSGEGGGWQPGEGEGRVVLQSCCFVTPVDEGTVCCTVISEAHAFEYILYESQKGAGIEVDGEGVLLSGGAVAAVAP